MALHQGIRNRTTTVLPILAIAVAYFGAGELGLQLAAVGNQLSPLWPATGVAVAGLLLWGLRVWPGILLSAYVLDLLTGPSPVAAMMSAAGTTLACVLVYLLLRWVKFDPTLIRLKDAMTLTFLGTAAMLVSSSVGTLTLLLYGAVSSAEIWTTWSVWWTGDTMGLLVVTPLLLAIHMAPWPPFTTPKRWVEAGVLLAGTAAVAWGATHAHAMLFLTFPLLIWTALRFQLLGAMTCALIVSVTATLAAIREVGPFHGLSEVATMVQLQAFDGTVALTALLLSAVTAQRNQAHRTIERAVGQLTEELSRKEPSWNLLDVVNRPRVSRRSPPRR